MTSTITAPELRFQGDDASLVATRRTTHAIDGIIVLASMACLLASMDVGATFGRRWFVAGFAMLGPGWGLIRACGRSASSLTIFLAVATSLASMQLAGHLAVTLFAWHWAPVMAVLAIGTIAGTSYGWWQDDVWPTVAAPPEDPLGLLAAADDEDTDPHGPNTLGTIASVGAFGAFLGLVGLFQTDVGGIDKLGLLPALPLLALVGAAMVCVAALAVTDGTARARAAYVGLVGALIVLLFGSVGVIEAHPRFSVAWLHVGFIDAISTRGELLTSVDARFSWPGFFSGGALIQRLAATDDVLWLVRYYPVFAIATLALGLWALGRVLGLRERSCATAVVLFVVVNWSAQDYFSPQSVGVVLYLAVLVLALGLFPGPGPKAGGVLARALDRRPDREVRPLVGLPRTLAMVVVLVMSMSLVISHQLTPMFLTGVLLVLGFANLISLRWIGITVGLITLSWLSFGGEAWWQGNVDALFGPLGQVNGIVEANLSDRASGAIPERTVIVALRIGVSLALWVGAVLALIVRRRSGLGRAHLTLGVLVLAVIPPLVAQPYGGELLIRIFLFSALPACLLVGDLIAQREIRRQLAVGVVLAGLVPVFFLTRFGNEAYEIVTDADVAVSEALLDVVPEGGVVVTGNNITLFYTDRVGEMVFVDGNAARSVDFAEQVETIGQKAPTFVYFTESQALYEQYTQDLDADWLEQTLDGLIATGDYEVRYRDGVNAVLELVG